MMNYWKIYGRAIQFTLNMIWINDLYIDWLGHSRIIFGIFSLVYWIITWVKLWCGLSWHVGGVNGFVTDITHWVHHARFSHLKFIDVWFLRECWWFSNRRMFWNNNRIFWTTATTNFQLFQHLNWKYDTLHISMVLRLTDSVSEVWPWIPLASSFVVNTNRTLN